MYKEVVESVLSSQTDSRCVVFCLVSYGNGLDDGVLVL